MKNNLNQLKKEESDLLKKLDENRAMQKVIHIDSFVREHKVNLGDDIEFIESGKPYKGRVYSFNCDIDCVMAVNVMLFKSDGTLGKKEYKCWRSNFESIKKVK